MPEREPSSFRQRHHELHRRTLGEVAVDDEALGPVIVAVGASSGCIDALETFVAHLSLRDAGLVVISQAGRQRDMALLGRLRAATNLPVQEAQDGLPVDPGCIIFVSSGVRARVEGGRLRVGRSPARAPESARLPPRMDAFLRSLAADCGPRAMAVVLAGAGSDARLGLEAVKAAGGLTFAQAPVPDGLEIEGVDFVLSPEALAAELDRLIPPRARRPLAADLPDVGGQSEGWFPALLALVRAATGQDLTPYKRSFLARRIERRMALHRIDAPGDYLKLARSDPRELRLLHRDLLVGVTRFFRDGDVWDLLATRTLPELLQASRPENGLVRVWVPGCSTGEEAYSLAILFAELLGDAAPTLAVRIFATDVDRSAIEHARRGIFLDNVTLDVSPARLRRFFIRREGRYQITRRIRELIVFSTHDVTRDAPLSRMDLVSCRNLLIGLAPSAQSRVLQFLHYALRPSGRLVLGATETPGELPEHFAPIDGKLRLYRKRPSSPTIPLGLSDAIVPSAHEPANPGAALGRAALPDPDRCAERAPFEPRLVPLRGEPSEPAELGPAPENKRAHRPMKGEVARELSTLRRHLGTSIENLECANEELRSVIEELQSSNEELQATNEELETSREQLQCANDELLGVNDELQIRMTDLRLAHDDVRNILDVVDSAIVVVGMEGTMRRFNRVAERLFGLKSDQLGLPLGRLSRPLGGQEVEDIVFEVIETLVPFDGRLVGPGGHGYGLRVIPYKTGERAIRGAVLALSEVLARVPSPGDILPAEAS